MVFQKHEFNGSEIFHWNWQNINSFIKSFYRNKFKLNILYPYRNFNVTTANTTDKMVTTQNLTAILLSWYPSF